jgi:hypothetical protein
MNRLVIREWVSVAAGHDDRRQLDLIGIFHHSGAYISSHLERVYDFDHIPSGL